MSEESEIRSCNRKKEGCVLIPCYNVGDDLLNSLSSIDTGLVDVVIVDDGSMRPVKDLLTAWRYSEQVHVIRYEKNLGIEHALNEGLKYCKERYKYIFRLDCGDVCINNRFEIQLNYLKENPSVVLLGGAAEYISASGDHFFTFSPPGNDSEIKRKMYLNNMFIHPAVAIRTSILSDVGLYSDQYTAAEDYELFFRITRKFDVSNLTTPVIKYVVDDNSISSRKRSMQVRSRIKVIRENFYFGVYPIMGLIKAYVTLWLPRSSIVRVKNVLGWR